MGANPSRRRRSLLGAVTALVIVFVAPVKADDPPTYTQHVEPILRARCMPCHQVGHVGPFKLETYEHARKRAADIAAVAADRSMPPWKAEPGVGPKFRHDQSLTIEEIATLEAWADAEAPQGSPVSSPVPILTPPPHALGDPDLVLETAEDFAVPASGSDLYRCFVLPTGLTEDVYISALDFRPMSPQVVHHITAFVDFSGDGRRRDSAEAGPGYTSYAGPGIPNFDMLSFWAAGHQPIPWPEGTGLRLPRGADVILQVHYHPTGKPEIDRIRVGVHLTRGPVKRAVHWNAAQNFELRLPAGKSRIEVKALWYVPADCEALAVAPHMHSLGRDFRMDVRSPDGRTTDLISIPDWDPAWQAAYHFQEPFPLPRGSMVRVVAHYDNSAGNPRNPNRPPKAVRYGHAAEDEMCDGFIAVVRKNQDLTQPGAVDDLAYLFAKQRLKLMRRLMAKQTRADDRLGAGK